MTNKKTICIYHANCADGFAGAWVVRQALGAGQVDFHPGIYGETPPDVAGKAVVMVDFSYPRAVIEQMAEVVSYVLILDHHQSAIADLASLAHPNVYTIMDTNRSGARIAWDYFSTSGETPPKLLQHIEDRDLWRFQLDGTRQIQASLFSLPYDFEQWDRLMALQDLGAMRQEGEAIERKHQKDIDELLKITARFMTIGDHLVPVANLPYTMASDGAGQLAVDMPFAATYYDTEKERVFSLRSANTGLDVSEIAAQYGGGGHKHAAGFRVPLAQAWRMETAWLASGAALLSPTVVDATWLSSTQAATLGTLQEVAQP